MGKYEQLAKEIVKEVGGTENINSVTHCITRLRFRLKDESKANDKKIEAMDEVVTVMHSAGQYQVVIGNKVPYVYEDVCAVAGIKADTSSEEEEEAPKGVFNKLMDIISGCFSPILGVMCAAGIIKGLNALLSFLLGGSYGTSGTYMVLNATGDAIFTFLPVALGYSSAKKFKLNPMIGMVIGLGLCYPNIQLSALESGKAIGTLPVFGKYYKTFSGIPLLAGNYTSTVIPVLLLTALAAKIEKAAKKLVPEMLQNFFVPFFVLIITLPLGFLIIGPVVTLLTNLLSSGFSALYKASPVATGAVVGFFWQALVIFGLHWALVPLGLLNLTQLGYDTILFTGFFGASFAQTAALFAMYLKMKDKKRKNLALPAVISGLCGVTEPSIYGFTLPAKTPFIASMVGGGVAGGLINALGTKCYIYGGLGIFGFTNYISPKGDASGMFNAIVSCAIAMVIGFVLTFILWKDDAPAKQEEKVQEESKQLTDQVIASPMNGEVIALEDLKDAAFASGALGKGCGISPEISNDTPVYAPVTGTVTTLFPTLHAIGLTADDGTEVLIHIGLNTVQLEGKGFTSQIKQGDHVNAGDLLMNVDFAMMSKEGYEIQTPIIITNTNDYKDVLVEAKGQVKAHDVLLETIA